MARKKKSYNPFKMWGSYVGLIGLPLISYISASKNTSPTGLELFYRNIGRFFGGANSGLSFDIGIVFMFITGLLIGLVIHSLIRRFKK